MADPEKIDTAKINPEATPEAAAVEKAEKSAEPEWKRKARLAAIFGDALPEATKDDRAEGSSGYSEQWWREQMPPHHGQK